MTPMEMISNGLAWYVVFLFSTTFHEAAHAWAGMRMGDLTAYYGGQVSLNPIPHIKRERFGMVVVPIISFLMFQGNFMLGWASAPFNPNWATRYPKRAAIMSLAGPAANILLVVFSCLAIRAGLEAGVFVHPENASLVAVAEGAPHIFTGIGQILGITLLLNLLLAVFNLMPFPPMDGSGALTLFMNREMALRYRHGTSSLQFVGLMLAWYVFPYIFTPVVRFVIGVLYY